MWCTLDVVATVETQIPLTKVWDAQEVERYDNVTLIDIDKYIKKYGKKAAKFGRRVTAFALRQSLKSPTEEVIFEATSAINEHFVNTEAHGESPRMARIISLGDVSLIDIANKKTETSNENCAGVGDLLIQSRFGEDCVEREVVGDMCYTRIPIDLDNPIKDAEIQTPSWPELE